MLKVFPLLWAGKGSLPSLATPPELLIHLLTATDTRGRTFRDNIRAYNSALVFASFGVNLDEELANARHGVYTFRIHGVVHHYIGQLRPREGEAPSCAQIYIHDGTAEGELESRSRHLGEASFPELRGLQVMLHEVNPYVTFFKQGVDLMKNIGDNIVRMIIRSDGTPDTHRYNALSAPEIAVIIPGDGYSEGVASRDIVLHEHTGGLQRITESHCAFYSLHYVLLFPLGDNGWHLKIPHSKGKGDITAMEFYSFRLMVRSSISYLHLFGRLFHQYLVDMFAKIEQQRLNYIKFNQQKIRVDLYSGLADAISFGDSNPREVGRRVILPSSFTGSPRQMFEVFQDSMSIVTKYGKPDLFITFTCNPKWEGVSSALLFFQKSTDRPDLIVRVFRLKFRELLKDICNNHVLGKPLAHVYTIEHSDLENVLSRQKHTTQTGWFIANERFPSSRDITYTTFPDKFVWEKTKREWKEREKGHGKMIGRVYSAHPGEGECFYLRMLLSHVTGCTCYQDIRSLPDGTVCPTYKEPARRWGLLDDDQEYDDCLTEISMHAMPSELRELFVNILLCNEPTDPLALWNKHKESLAKDFLLRARIFSPQVELNERILNTALLDIDNRLETVGKSLSDFPDMPVPNKNRSSYEQPRVIQDELDYSEADQVTITEKNISLINTDQLAIFNCIIAALNQPDIEQRAFFIDGPGGTGKTFLYYTLLAKIRSQGQIALAMASSRIAALLRKGGRTVHSRMKVPIS